jgi:hypothetical protein
VRLVVQVGGGSGGVCGPRGQVAEVMECAPKRSFLGSLKSEMVVTLWTMRGYRGTTHNPLSLVIYVCMHGAPVPASFIISSAISPYPPGHHVPRDTLLHATMPVESGTAARGSHTEVSTADRYLTFVWVGASSNVIVTPVHIRSVYAGRDYLCTGVDS